MKQTSLQNKKTKPKRKSRINVALVELGDHLPINPGKLIKTLNSIQKVFDFSLVNAINGIEVGEPTIEYTKYSTKQLFQTINNLENITKFAYIIGITGKKVVEEEEPEYLLFSLGDYKGDHNKTNKVAMISLNQDVLKFNHPALNSYQYTVYLLVCELLQLMYGDELLHLQTRRCVFDECADYIDFSDGIITGEICEKDQKRLLEHGISKTILDNSQQMLSWSKKILLLTAVRNTFLNPFFVFISGITLGWIVAAFFQAASVNWVIIGQFLITTGVFYYEKNKKYK